LLTTIALAVAVAAAATALTAPAAHATTTGHFGPRNPAFVAWLHDRAAGPLVSSTANGHSLKPLPPVPVDPVAWSTRALRRGPLALGDTTFPTSYDPRDPTDDPNDYLLLPAIRDQGPDDDCWAYASIASLEWSLLPATTLYGEYDLAYKAAGDFDWGLQDGGNYDIATAELARWHGPVSASAGVDNDYTPGLPTLEHVQNVLFLPDRSSSTDNDTIKVAVQQYGAVYTAMYADGDPVTRTGMEYDTTSEYFNASTSAYYYFPDPTGSQPYAADHAVDIVGWDDDYPATNFSTEPMLNGVPLNGAFICRNSWGTSWGDQSTAATQGYFYVSYADALIGTSMAVFTGEPTTDYAQNLGHDTLGFTDSYGFGTDTAWMAAGYTVKGDSSLEAAGLYALSPETTYTLYVGTSLTNRATWTPAGSGTLDVAGYHTITFSAPYSATAGRKFYVIAELDAPSSAQAGGPIALEDAIQGYSSKATSAPGQSYVSSDGSQWTDLDVAWPSYRPDVCLKVFAGAAAPDPSRPVTKALAAASVVRGHAVNLRYRVNDATGKYDVEKVVIRVRTKAGKLVKTITVGSKQPNTSLSYRYLCKLPRGSYRWYVYATDRWGNTQSSVGRAALTVR
jgi:C1A family cysteine protease